MVLLADGFEEVEAVTPIDYLRRAGIAVTTASIGDGLGVRGARGISINADVSFGDLVKRGKAHDGPWDAVIVPGGIPGAPNIAASREAGALIAGMAAAEKLVCAICASPALVLAPLGILDGRRFTCYPGMEEKVPNGEYLEEPVVTDGNVVTSRGAGTSGLFSVAIIDRLLGKTDGEKIAKAVLL